MHNSFSASKAIYGPSTQEANPLRSKDQSTLFKDSFAINSWWKEHFRSFWAAILMLQAIPSKLFHNIPLRTTFKNHKLKEALRGIRQIKNNKTCGLNGYQLKCICIMEKKALLPALNIILKIWKYKQIPSDLKDERIFSILKKGDRLACSNYHGIVFLSIAWKILTLILSSLTLHESQWVSDHS